MQVFKFGGASVKDANAVKNVSEIVRNYSDNQLIVIVSAMGKTTNALEIVVRAWKEKQVVLFQEKMKELKNYHFHIVDGLFDEASEELASIKFEINYQLATINQKFDLPFSENYDFEYDQIVSIGEVISTKIIAAYLQKVGLDAVWQDARNLIRTDRTYRNGEVDWNTTEILISKYFQETKQKIAVTQGFIGHTPENFTTTLGREGSDYTAAIFAYCTNAENVTIWKDVPGMLNADPKYFENTVKLDQISYKEAIELAYYGASVIHPKTIKPLQNKSIPLYVKSFVSPEAEGTTIYENTENDSKIPSYIFKSNQLLVSVMAKDFSFIAESSLQKIFLCLTKENVTINLMQNSAVSFSFLVDAEKVNRDQLITALSVDFKVRYNEDLELVTIRHYTNKIIDSITKGKIQLMAQSDRQTMRLVLRRE